MKVVRTFSMLSDNTETYYTSDTMSVT